MTRRGLTQRRSQRRPDLAVGRDLELERRGFISHRLSGRRGSAFGR